jgi:hypothetical protein
MNKKKGEIILIIRKKKGRQSLIEGKYIAKKKHTFFLCDFNRKKVDKYEFVFNLLTFSPFFLIFYTFFYTFFFFFFFFFNYLFNFF